MGTERSKKKMMLQKRRPEETMLRAINFNINATSCHGNSNVQSPILNVFEAVFVCFILDDGFCGDPASLFPFFEH